MTRLDLGKRARRVTLVHLVPHADLHLHPHPTTMADVDMKPADEKKEEKKAEEEKKVAPLTPVAEIKANVALIEKAVSTLEPRFTHRVLRSLTHLRRKLDDKVLQDGIQEVYRTGACAFYHPCRTPFPSHAPCTLHHTASYHELARLGHAICRLLCGY